MKKTILLFGLGLLFAACSDENASPVDDNTDPVNGNKVLLLQVDLLTNTFEGGKELEFAAAESFTIGHQYVAPGDFGSVALSYQELGQPLFEGSIIWMGVGHMTYPEALDAPTAFTVMDNEADMPPLSQFETVSYIPEGEGVFPPDEIDYEGIWESIDHLQQVEDYRTGNPDAKVHLFLYTPSVGFGNPAEWDWFVILKN